MVVKKISEYGQKCRPRAWGGVANLKSAPDGRHPILLTKTTAAQNDVALSYHRVRGLYFLPVVFAATIATPLPEKNILH